MIEVIEENRGLLFKFSGSVSRDDLSQLQRNMYSSASFDDLHYQIVDMLDMTDFSDSEEDLIEIAAIDKAAALSNPRIKLAVVATDDAIKQLLGVYQALLSDSPWETQVFSTMEEARSWIA